VHCGGRPGETCDELLPAPTEEDILEDITVCNHCGTEYGLESSNVLGDYCIMLLSILQEHYPELKGRVNKKSKVIDIHSKQPIN
jgi:hypothetical protein